MRFIPVLLFQTVCHKYSKWGFYQKQTWQAGGINAFYNGDFECVHPLSQVINQLFNTFSLLEPNSSLNVYFI